MLGDVRTSRWCSSLNCNCHDESIGAADFPWWRHGGRLDGLSRDHRVVGQRNNWLRTRQSRMTWLADISDLIHDVADHKKRW